MTVSLSRVLLSGFIAGLAMWIPDYFLHELGINKLQNLDWAAVVTFGHRPTSMGETLFAEFNNLLYTVLLGIVFVYLISRIVTNSNLYLRGLMFATGVWFIDNALAVMFKLPDLSLTLGSVSSNLISALVFGLVLTVMLRWFDKNTEKHKIRARS